MSSVSVVKIKNLRFVRFVNFDGMFIKFVWKCHCRLSAESNGSGCGKIGGGRGIGNIWVGVLVRPDI